MELCVGRLFGHTAITQDGGGFHLIVLLETHRRGRPF